jgi:hypothetical protein
MTRLSRIGVGGAQLLCATGTIPQPCGGTYPQTTGVRLFPIPHNLTTMPSPCDGVPATVTGPCSQVLRSSAEQTVQR